MLPRTSAPARWRSASPSACAEGLPPRKIPARQLHGERRRSALSMAVGLRARRSRRQLPRAEEVHAAMFEQRLASMASTAFTSTARRNRLERMKLALEQVLPLRTARRSAAGGLASRPAGSRVIAGLGDGRDLASAEANGRSVGGNDCGPASICCRG